MFLEPDFLWKVCDFYIKFQTIFCKILEEKLPENALGKYLSNNFSISNDEKLIIRKFGHGQSNPTYYIKFGKKEFVLRKKPVKKIQFFWKIFDFTVWKTFSISTHD